MPRAAAQPENITRDVLIETYAANGVMNQILFDHLDPRAWRAIPAGFNKGEGRTIAAIFVHLHNSRLVWIRRSAPHLACPAPLDPDRSTPRQIALAHKRSAARCLEMLVDALSDSPKRRVTRFSRGSWTRDWPAGASMFAYMFAHEAHHRGQVMMLAHLLGCRLPPKYMGAIWQWDKIWKQLGFPRRPR